MLGLRSTVKEVIACRGNSRGCQGALGSMKAVHASMDCGVFRQSDCVDSRHACGCGRRETFGICGSEVATLRQETGCNKILFTFPLTRFHWQS